MVAAAGYESLRQNSVPLRPAAGQALIGVGLSVFSERTAYGTPVFGQRLMGITPGYETAHVRIDPSGGATVLAGTVSHTVRGTPLPRWSPTGCADPDPGAGGPRGHRRRPLRLGNLRQQVGGAVG